MRALIADDDRSCRLILRSLLEENHPEVEIVAEAESGEDALKQIREAKPELLFLDIHMPDLTGFEVVERMEQELSVLFVTTSEEHALRAFDINALDYLVKPVELSRLTRALEKAQRMEPPNKPSTRFELDDLAFLRLEGKQQFLRVDLIDRISGEGNYSRVFTTDGRQFVVKKSLSHWQRQLPANQFFRIDRNQMVRLSEVEFLEKRGSVYELQLRGNESWIPVSRRRGQALKSLLTATQTRSLLREGSND